MCVVMCRHTTAIASRSQSLCKLHDSIVCHTRKFSQNEMYCLVACEMASMPCMSLQEVNGKHLLKAEPLNAILDPQYFIRQVHECVVRVLNDRAAREHQAATQSSFYRYNSAHSSRGCSVPGCCQTLVHITHLVHDKCQLTAQDWLLCCWLMCQTLTMTSHRSYTYQQGWPSLFLQSFCDALMAVACIHESFALLRGAKV